MNLQDFCEKSAFFHLICKYDDYYDQHIPFIIGV